MRHAEVRVPLLVTSLSCGGEESAVTWMHRSAGCLNRCRGNPIRPAVTESTLAGVHTPPLLGRMIIATARQRSSLGCAPMTMSLLSDEERRWVPTHVQVTVLRARGLRAKGKHGTSDVYTIIQLAKEKYSTCVVEKTTEPEWGEECSFELLPGILEEEGREAYPPGSGDLTLTVMHRALIGLDVFLGQAVLPLHKAFQERKSTRNEWHRLHSKSGKKEKERGELQLIVQFTRHNLTASMYDLSLKDKPRSAFDKLRERMRAKKRSREEDSSSAIVPGGYGALARMRARLPSDGGGEEDYEDDEGGEVRRSKMRSFFLRGRLRKSSDTRSSTSLGSESSESSSRGGSLSPTAGISVVVSDLSNSPSNSSNLTADNSPDHTVAPSPQVSPVRHVMYDISLPVPLSAAAENDSPILLPSVCVNGNPVETSPLTHHPPLVILQQPQPETVKPVTESGPELATKPPATSELIPPAEPKPQETPHQSKPRLDPWLPALGVLQKGTLSLSLQNLSRRVEEKQSGVPVDGRRWSFDKPGEEEKAAIVAALEHAGRVTDEAGMETVMPAGETETQSKKRRGLFSHGKGPVTSKEESEGVQAPVEVKHKGWFSSKDSHSKPSSLLHPQPHSSGSEIYPVPSYTFPDLTQNMADQHASCSLTSPSRLSEENPFLTRTEHNPFYTEIHTDVALFHDGLSLFSSHSDGKATPDLLRIENNIISSQKDVPKDPSISKVLHSKDDFEDFAKDRLAPSEKVNTTQDLAVVTTILAQPHDSSGDMECKMVMGASTLAKSGDVLDEMPQDSQCDNLFWPRSDKPVLSTNGAESFTEQDIHLSESSLPDGSNVGCPNPVFTACSKTINSAEDPAKTSQMAKLHIQQPSVTEEVDSPSACSEISEGVSGCPQTHVQTENPKEVNVEDIVFCKGDCSGDTLQQFVVISDSFGGDLEQSSMESYHSDITLGNILQYNEEIGRSNASGGKSLVEAIEPTRIPDTSATGTMVTPFPERNEDQTLKNESGDFLLELASYKNCSEKIFLDCPSFPRLFKEEESIVELQSPYFTGNLLSPISEEPEMQETFPERLLFFTPGTRIETDEDPSDMVCSPGNVLLYNPSSSADSEQYLSCVSQQDSISSRVELSQQSKHDLCMEDAAQFEPVPNGIRKVSTKATDDVSLECTTEVMAESFKALPNLDKSWEFLPKTCLLDPSASESSSTPLHHNSENTASNARSDFESIPSGKHELSDNYLTPVVTLDVIAELEAQLAQLDKDTSLVDSQEEHKDNFLRIETLSKDVLHEAHLAEPNLFGSIYANSSIFQDNGTPDHNKDILEPQPHLGTSKKASAASEPVQNHRDVEPFTEPSKGLNLDEFWTTSQVLQSVTPDLFSVNWPILPKSPIPLTPHQNVSPVMSSTPHLGLSNNLQPFPNIPSTIVDAFPTMQCLDSTLYNPFVQDLTQMSKHQSSPHPVKPLTPPEEKKSESRSVLEKLRSTIHPGRSHHTDQDADKKPLVEGGGSYYHLNHSELVSLLLQRDNELRQEREDYEKRRALLEKRENELKKMKFLIRDLEDYIDTLLVRIMEQTPTLLQVRSKMK
ncbi:hypothetical protein DNTS_015174 [Danionella cerebrum]|uniref:C2 domain-containing protein n=1 Tax=Danionella cerebrum TaxID=2873325 RepID=A0A553MZI1_9TELE|nr:hypothetical protein DNTS_015174 [Danionella translucida]TRY58592.1 hypothetical protein DNTS_015174 [Danionella translucida]